MSLTPDQERKRQSLIQKFNEDWEFRTKTLEIARKKKSGFAKIIDLVWKRKYKVKTLYLWVSKHFSGSILMAYPFPLRHDNMPKTPNMPTKFILEGGWSIPEADLKCLLEGPLLSEDGRVLVKPNGQLSYYWNKYWPRVVVIATILGLIRGIAWLIGLF